MLTLSGDFCSVAVCDSQPILMEGIRFLLETQTSFRVTLQAQSAEDLLSQTDVLRPKMVLIDNSLFQQGIPFWENLQKQGTALVVWGTDFRECEAIRVLKLGVQGIILKSASLDDLVSCLSTAAENRVWVDASLLLADRKEEYHSVHFLTHRERQILSLIRQGLKNREIAINLGICHATVRIHIRNIFKKTGIRGRYHQVLPVFPENSLIS
jgi:DNA-binding NarL/FixJ family response regulator